MLMQENKMKKQTIEQRLAEHAKQAGITGVVQAKYNHPFACLLTPFNDQIGNKADYIKGYLGWKRTGNISEDIVDLVQLDDNPKVPKNWNEVAKRFLTRKATPERKPYFGTNEIIDAPAGNYIRPEALKEILEHGGISEQEFELQFGFNPNLGIALIDGEMPNREYKTSVQIHETIHARDRRIGFLPEDFRVEETLTDLRTHMFTLKLFGEGFLERQREYEEVGLKVGVYTNYISPTRENINIIKSLVGNYDPRTNMKEILVEAKKRLVTDPRFRILFSGCREFDTNKLTDKQKIELVSQGIDELIHAESKTNLPQVVPGGLQ